jgi:hypothetical protein
MVHHRSIIIEERKISLLKHKNIRMMKNVRIEELKTSVC